MVRLFACQKNTCIRYLVEFETYKTSLSSTPPLQITFIWCSTTRVLEYNLSEARHQTYSCASNFHKQICCNICTLVSLKCVGRKAGTIKSTYGNVLVFGVCSSGSTNVLTRWVTTSLFTLFLLQIICMISWRTYKPRAHTRTNICKMCTFACFTSYARQCITQKDNRIWTRRWFVCDINAIRGFSRTNFRVHVCERSEQVLGNVQNTMAKNRESWRDTREWELMRNSERYVYQWKFNSTASCVPRASA